MRSAIAECLQRRQRVLQILANGFERQDMNTRDDRREAIALVDPDGFLPPDDAVDGEAAQR